MVLAEALAAFVLFLAGIYDVKYREIPSKIMYYGVVIVAIASLIENKEAFIKLGSEVLLQIYLALTLILVLIAFIVYKLSLFGEGDFYAFLLIGVSSPFRDNNVFFPTIYVTLFYYVAIIVAIIAYTAIRNIVHYFNHLSKLSPKYAIIYLFTAKPIKLQEYIKKPGWWYPVAYCNNLRTSFDIYKNPEDEVAKLEKLVKEKKCKLNETIWVSYGMPAVFYLAIAYILSLILKDYPLLYLIGSEGHIP